MKKRILALAAAAMLVMTSASAFAADDFDASKGAGVDTKVALITMDQMDVHWVRLKNAATDNYAGGVQAGEYMKKVLDEAGVKDGTIGIVDAQAGVESCENRYQGFASVFEGTDFTLGERQYSDGDNAKAQELANTLIANGVVAIYGTNDGATNGAAAAVKDAASNGETIYCVGWDKSDSNIAHVEGGELLAFMAQNPNVMGEKAIDAVVAMKWLTQAFPLLTLPT